MKKFFGGLFAIVLTSCFALTGCAGLTSANSAQDVEKTPLQQTQEYVSSIDSHAADISKKADEYITAIGKSDAVAAKLKFEEITAALDECAKVEIPDAIKDEGEKYKQACTDLKDALSGLNDIANGKVTEADMQTKMQEAQDKYTQASTNLSDADKALNEKLEEIKNNGVTKPQA